MIRKIRDAALLAAMLALSGSRTFAQAADPTPPPPPVAASPDIDGKRIVGGHAVEAGGAKWQVEIVDSPIYQTTESGHVAGQRKFSRANLSNGALWNWEHECGGALIAPGWVMTAGHCVTPAEMKKGHSVRLGVLDLSTAGWQHRIDKVYVHPGYTEATDAAPSLNDIALVHYAATLMAPPDVATAAPAGPPTYRAIAVQGFAAGSRPLQPPDHVFVTGWGRTTTRDFNVGKTDAQVVPPYSKILQEVGLNVVDAAHCGARLKITVTPGMVCATAADKDSCSGDSGGPMRREVQDPDHPRDEEGQALKRDVLVGLVSWGSPECGTAPGVYTQVSAYTQWIRDVLGKDASRLLH